jgi:hypothetical protein
VASEKQKIAESRRTQHESHATMHLQPLQLIAIAMTEVL